MLSKFDSLFTKYDHEFKRAQYALMGCACIIASMSCALPLIPFAVQ